MSKTIRIREHLYAEIEARARQERRSIIGQLEILLEQALAMREPAKPPEPAIPQHALIVDANDHFKPDPK